MWIICHKDNQDYDVETQLYWVSSRYYSTELCRWISPDDVNYLDPEFINGLNLYAYCGNDPVNNIDPSGNAFFSVLALALIGITVSGVLNGVANVVSMSESETVLGAFVGGFIEGSVSAAALAAGLAIGTVGGIGLAIVGASVAVGGAFIGGKYGNAASQQISYGNVDWGIANINGGFAAATNLFCYLGFYVNKDFMSTAPKFGTRFLENAGPSSVAFGVTSYFGSLPKPSLNEYRSQERIESRKGRFIWDYLF